MKIKLELSSIWDDKEGKKVSKKILYQQWFSNVSKSHQFSQIFSNTQILMKFWLKIFYSFKQNFRKDSFFLQISGSK